MELAVVLLAVFAGQRVVAGLLTGGGVTATPAGPKCCQETFVCRWRYDDCMSVPTEPPRTATPGGLLVKKLLGHKLPPPLTAADRKPPPTHCYVPAVVLVWVTVYVAAWLLGISVGLIPPVKVQPSHLWVLYPFTQTYLGLAYLGLAPLLGTTSSCALGPTDRTLSHGVFGTFSALVLQGVSSYCLTCAGPKKAIAHIVHPPTAIYAIAWSYYAYKTLGAPPVVPRDVFGLSLQPLHLFLWMCSTATQCILCQTTYQLDCCGGGAVSLPAPALLATLVMLWSGLLGFLDYGPEAGAWGLGLNVAFNLLSCASFYALLLLGTRPLRLCAEYYAELHEQRAADGATPPPLVHVAQTLHRQFVWARRYLWVTWHSFPLVWLLGAFGLVDGETREVLFTLADLMAKFLPVSMYLALLAVPQ